MKFEMEKLVDVKRVSDITGISEFTIRKLCRLHKIPCYKPTRHYKFRESEIATWLESKRQEVVKDLKVELVREYRVC